MKEQQKRKFKQIHPEIEDGIDLRRYPLLLFSRSWAFVIAKAAFICFTQDIHGFVDLLQVIMIVIVCFKVRWDDYLRMFLQLLHQHHLGKIHRKMVLECLLQTRPDQE